MSGLGVHFNEDIHNALCGVALAGVHHGPAYLRALRDLAVVLGVDPPPYPAIQDITPLRHAPVVDTGSVTWRVLDD